jgi:hypothetical protein
MALPFLYVIDNNSIEKVPFWETDSCSAYLEASLGSRRSITLSLSVQIWSHSSVKWIQSTLLLRSTLMLSPSMRLLVLCIPMTFRSRRSLVHCHPRLFYTYSASVHDVRGWNFVCWLLPWVTAGHMQYVDQNARCTCSNSKLSRWHRHEESKHEFAVSLKWQGLSFHGFIYPTHETWGPR